MGAVRWNRVYRQERRDTMLWNFKGRFVAALDLALDLAQISGNGRDISIYTLGFHLFFCRFFPHHTPDVELILLLYW